MRKPTKPGREKKPVPPQPPRAKALEQANKRLAGQTREILGKHYANRYRVR